MPPLSCRTSFGEERSSSTPTSSTACWDATRIAGTSRRLFGKAARRRPERPQPGARPWPAARRRTRRRKELPPDGTYCSRKPWPTCRRSRASSPPAPATRSPTFSCWPATSASRTSRWTSRSCSRCSPATAAYRPRGQPFGHVEMADDGPEWSASSGRRLTWPSRGPRSSARPPEARPLGCRLIGLDELRATTPGRSSGPRRRSSASLRLLPRQRGPGRRIPFGLFREALLDRPFPASGKTVSVDGRAFRRLEALPQGSTAGARGRREKLRAPGCATSSATTDPGPRLPSAVCARPWTSQFGAGFHGGVFVRSDTNVEDLPGFTGAGINLTLPNVVSVCSRT